MEQAVAKERVNETALARFERWALPRMAAALPAWVTPDMLTLLALVAAFVSAAAYYFAADHLAWLHVASLGFFVHWWGDSLDGTLARVRDIRRERYGFFVDHEADAIGVTVIFVALGWGGLMRVELALGMAIGFLLLMNLVNMVAIVRDVFKISFAGGGPTELRIIMIVVNTVVWALGPWTLTLLGRVWRPFDLFGLVASVGLVMVYLVTSVVEWRLLAKLDPPPQRPTPRDPGD